MNGKGTKVDRWLAYMVIMTLACMVGMLIGAALRYVAELLFR